MKNKFEKIEKIPHESDPEADMQSLEYGRYSLSDKELQKIHADAFEKAKLARKNDAEARQAADEAVAKAKERMDRATDRRRAEQAEEAQHSLKQHLSEELEK